MDQPSRARLTLRGAEVQPDDIVELVVEQCRQILKDCNFLITEVKKGTPETQEDQWKMMEAASLTTRSVIKIITASKMIYRNPGDVRGRASLSRFQKHSSGRLLCSLFAYMCMNSTRPPQHAMF